MAQKKDSLCIRWVHGKYLINKDWWGYNIAHDVCWYWSKLCSIKEEFKWGSSELKKWHWKSNPNGDYRVIFGYESYLNLQHRKPRWTKLVWPRPATPRHSFIAWLLLKQNLPVNTRLAKYIYGLPTGCDLCNEGDKMLEHLFLNCTHAWNMWKNITSWLRVPCPSPCLQGWYDQLL